MSRPFFIICLILLLTCVSPLSAQEFLKGYVTAEGSPVEFANVGVVSEGRPYGTMTDTRGFYRLAIRTTDSVTVRVSYTGYEPQEFRLALKPSETYILDVNLIRAAMQLPDVVVSDDRIRSTTFTEVDIQRIENTVGPTSGVESLIKTLPDVNSNNELSSQYSVRGGSFDENLVYINGVEVYRPQLIRSGQQEGMSIVNPDMVDHLLFSPGGFDATYGDRMSSVLDIIYNRPIERRHSLSLSLLGEAASAQGRLGEDFSYSVGFRQHSNRYLFKSMDTEGQYTSSYTDLQTVLGWRMNEHVDLSLLAIWTKNNYGLVPATATTTFGSFQQSLELHVYFDGQEVDKYSTLLGSFVLDYHPSDDFQLRWITSAQHNVEQELYDIQDQYFLYEVGVGEQAGDTNHFDRGVGTFLEHARNYLNLGIYSTEFKAIRYALLGNWYFGVKGQVEKVSDKIREWKWVDSAGYSVPTNRHIAGFDDTVVFNPILNLFCNADNSIDNIRCHAYLQREVNLFTRHDDQIKLFVGMRGQYYRSWVASASGYGQILLSPRLSVNYKPNSNRDILYRLTAGVYQQPYLYREMRRTDGSLHHRLPAQCSYQATGTFDWNFQIGSKPFRLTADLYYKYIDHLVPYTIDNLRVRYNPDQDAVGYATGISLRVNGDFVPNLESWASISLMKTQEDILGDGLGWLSRPTDQRLSFKVFLQDYMPTIPWWRMSLSLLYGSQTPTTFPYQKDRSLELHLPAYFRVDWGNTIQLTRFNSIRHSKVGRLFDDISLGIEVFNLFNYHNVVSFLWVSDYTGIYHAVPNYLTARQLNIKLNVTF